MSEQPLIDYTVLASLKTIMGRDFSQLIDTYLKDSELCLCHMQKALASGNSEALRRAAHSFKGSCSNIGATSLVAHSQHIEQAAASDYLVGLETVLIALKSNFGQVRQQLAVYL